MKNILFLQKSAVMLTIVFTIYSCTGKQPEVEERLFTPSFTSDIESFRQYRYPEWFRDAKFGIWAHWGPQAVPRQGDWYARKLYEEGGPVYKFHYKH